MSRKVLPVWLGLALVLVAGVTHAEEGRVVGGMTPLAEEFLAQSIALTGKCRGVLVRECRVGVPGSEVTPAAIRLMDRICNRAVRAFDTFIAENKLGRAHSRPLTWSMSLLPDGSCFRCLNDMKYRFAHRYVQRNLWGYTGLYQRYTFIINEICEGGAPNPIWRRAWVHELFHALSMHSGVFDAHADNDADRVRTDERLAAKFERAVLGQ